MLAMRSRPLFSPLSSVDSKRLALRRLILAAGVSHLPEDPSSPRKRPFPPDPFLVPTHYRGIVWPVR